MTKATGHPKATYHHGNLRQALLLAAFEHLHKTGPEKLSLRALARDVGVSQTAPYRHFPNKDLLFVAMAVEGFRRLEQRVQETSQSNPDAYKALLLCAEDYIAFAQENPALYRLMFGPALNEWRKPEFMHGAPPAALAALVEIMEKAISQGSITDEYEAWFLAKNCWAQIHGHAMMAIDGMLDKGMPEGFEFDLKLSLRLIFEGKRPHKR
ncbi:TetR/AcrR family transcriptional regulator [Sansalvadorimonas verongulae]|uniref:TetR/AcrR family transcriptional regulator n=1 Tax=Sansalvadorimonas verongulae TaxID=2172824 RepID=UPI0012BCA063|nr:TetR/AcrR family transcriptional regulator [Sansalvadorimonas verongulae]MTI14872.1 TetR/AcrR family transcriptional regulator [Sansalvadorimonas verongulae]